MRPGWIMLLSASLMASDAGAITGYLTTGACVDEPMAADGLDVDCASGGVVTVFGVFRPSHDIDDYVDLDATLAVTLPTTTFDQAPFWNFDAASPCATGFEVNAIRPAVGCATAVDPLKGAPVSGSAFNAYLNGPKLLISFTGYRSTPTSLVTGLKVFGFTMIVPVNNALEAGGSCGGCATEARLSWNAAYAYSASGNTNDIYDTNICIHGQCPPPLVEFNFNAGAVPVRARTWGQLKSLYR